MGKARYKGRRGPQSERNAWSEGEAQIEGKNIKRKARERTSFNIGKARNVTRFVVVVLVVVGFCVGLGWATPCVFGVDTIALICPLGVLESFLAAKSAAPPALFALLCAIVIVAFFGRAFCAWVCPVPPIQSFFPSKSAREEVGNEACAAMSKRACVAKCGTTHERAYERSETDAHESTCEKTCASFQKIAESCSCADRSLSPLGGKRDGAHIDSRHMVLLGALASSAVVGFPVFCLVCPVGLTFGTLFALWNVLVNHSPSWMLLLFPSILLIELVAFRKWCHVLCPLGAFMSLVGSKTPAFKPRVDAKRCLRAQGVDCHVCVDSCPEQLDPHVGSLSECTRCGLCKDSCPAQAVSLGRLSLRRCRSCRPGD